MGPNVGSTTISTGLRVSADWGRGLGPGPGPHGAQKGDMADPGPHGGQVMGLDSHRGLSKTTGAEEKRGGGETRRTSRPQPVPGGLCDVPAVIGVRTHKGSEGEFGECAQCRGRGREKEQPWALGSYQLS